MILADTAIKRPVFTTMIVLALLVLGYTAFTRMNVDLYPKVDIPVVMTTVVYPGAGPEAVESEITTKIEDAVNPIAGLDHIESISGEGYSLVVARFTLETDGAVAAQDVREKVSAIRSQLPDDIKEPVIEKFDFTSKPIISLVVSSKRPIKELTEFTRTVIKRRLESIEGIGAVRLVGGAKREILVSLNPDKLLEYGLSVQRINSAIAMANLDVPGGKVDKGNREIAVRTAGRFQKVSELENVIVSNKKGRQVYLSDIAAVYDTTEKNTSLTRYDGEVAVGLDIIRQSGANTVDVADRVKEGVKELNKTLPKDIHIDIVRDDSQFIRDSIDDVLVNIFYGGALAVFVIFLFLANIRSTIISAIAIPTSIIATFTFMSMLGFTLNMMSLLAMSLAVGLLIDDAIVVIENIYRHLSMGKSAWKAASEATSEIGLAVTATTFSIVVVFLPVAFMSGIVGRFFYQFGMSVVFAVLISLFIAFSLTPMLSSRFLREENKQAPVYRLLKPWNNAFEKLARWYYGVLEWSLRYRVSVLSIAIILFFVSLFIAKFLGTEFTPQSDRSELVVDFKAPPDFNLKATSNLAEKMENIIGKHPEVTDILTNIGSGNAPPNEGYLFAKLVDKSKRSLSDVELTSVIRRELNEKIPGTEFSLSNGQNMQGSEKQVEFSVRGQTGPRLSRLGESALQAMRSVPYAVDVSTSEKAGKPEYHIEVDRRAASDLGLSVGSIAMSVRSLIEGYVVSKFKEGSEEYDIKVRVPEKDIKDPSDMENIYLTSAKKVKGEDILVPIGRVAKITDYTGPTQLRRYDRMREIRIGSNVGLGGHQGDIANNFESAMSKIDIPSGYEITTVGSTEIMRDAFKNIFMALYLAVIFIYLLLASQFENFIDPLSIMLSLPLAIIGALVGLFIFGSPISIMSLIGIVLLMGLVTKNAILLIDFAKQRRAKGMERTKALLEAGQIRLRPILMTTFAMIFGMLPLVFALGPGAEIRAPMARAVIGGLISSTLLTLLIVPIVYSLLDDFAHSRLVSFIFHIKSNPDEKKLPFDSLS